MNARRTATQLLNIPRAALSAGVSFTKSAPARAMNVTHRVVSPVKTVTTTQVEIAYSKSLRVMQEIRKRATAPFRSASPGPDYQTESVYPPILSRL